MNYANSSQLAYNIGDNQQLAYAALKTIRSCCGPTLPPPPLLGLMYRSSTPRSSDYMQNQHANYCSLLLLLAPQGGGGGGGAPSPSHTKRRKRRSPNGRDEDAAACQSRRRRPDLLLLFMFLWRRRRRSSRRSCRSLRGVNRKVKSGSISRRLYPSG